MDLFDWVRGGSAPKSPIVAAPGEELTTTPTSNEFSHAPDATPEEVPPPHRGRNERPLLGGFSIPTNPIPDVSARADAPSNRRPFGFPPSR
jgi:hypothetical protein